MKVRLSDIVVRQREVALPETCPNCGTELDTEEAIAAVGLDWNYGGDTSMPVTEDDPRSAESVDPVGYTCEDCGHLLAWGKLAVIDAPSPDEENRVTWSKGIDRLVS